MLNSYSVGVGQYQGSNFLCAQWRGLVCTANCAMIDLTIIVWPQFSEL